MTTIIPEKTAMTLIARMKTFGPTAWGALLAAPFLYVGSIVLFAAAADAWALAGGFFGAAAIIFVYVWATGVAARRFSRSLPAQQPIDDEAH